MYFTHDKITEIFVLADEFCKEFELSISNHTIGNVPKKKPKMSSSEVICIMVLFHGMNQKTMKHFYLNFVQKYKLPLTMFLKLCCLGECTGSSKFYENFQSIEYVFGTEHHFYTLLIY